MKGSFLLILIILAVECADGDSARFVMEAAKRRCLEFCTEKFNNGSHERSSLACVQPNICTLERCFQCQSICNQKFSIQDLIAGQCRRYCVGRFPDVICSSSCRFLLDFYAQNAAKNSFDIPSNLTLMEQQVYREQLYLFITWSPPIGFQACHYYVAALPESATAMSLERRFVIEEYNMLLYRLGPVEPSTTYNILLAACTENYVCSDSASVIVTTMSCLQLYDNSLDHCVPPQPANVTAQVQQQDDKCGIMLSWQSAIPTAVSSSQLHYIVTWFAHSLDTDGSEADVHSVTLTQNITSFFIEPTSYNVWYSAHVQASSPRGSSSAASLTVFHSDCGDDKAVTAVSEETEPASISRNETVIAVISSGVSAALLCAGIILTVTCLRRRRVRKQQNCHKTNTEAKTKTTTQHFQLLADGRYPVPSNTSSNTQSPALPAAVSYEVTFQSISLHEELGRGAFGCVMRGRLNVVPLWLRGSHTAPTDVAVKMCKDDASRESSESLLKEIAMMLVIGRHEHIVSMVACCTTSPRMCLVMDYCRGGDLLTHLRSLRTSAGDDRGLKYISTPDRMVNSDGSDDSGVPESLVTCKTAPSVVKDKMVPFIGYENLPHSKILLYAKQVAIGMEYLAQKKVVHRDLAARNVLIASADCLKISDFGLSRDVYHNNFYCKTTSGKLPLRWMSVEAIFDQIYTTKSDVWAFGILLWEMVTLGLCPYPGVSMRQLPQLLREGTRMERPSRCDATLYSIMRQCWEANPNHRPTFTQLRAKFDLELEKFTATEASYLIMDCEM